MFQSEVHAERFVLKFRSRTYDLRSRTHIMGILNVTPDSFSDGGKFADTQRAIDRGVAMVEEGADIVDVGGESSRPGSDPVLAQEELRRVLPVIEGLAKRVEIPISIDTYKSEVAGEAIRAGAEIINDISGMTVDPTMMETAVRHHAAVVLMHMKGTPKTMQHEPTYKDVVGEVAEFLGSRAQEAERRGVSGIMVDPGIGFGKTLEHNLDLLRRLHRLTALGYPILIGPSRKSFIGKILDAPVEERQEGTAAAVTASILRGAHVVRVHEVRQMKKVALVADALKQSRLPAELP